MPRPHTPIALISNQPEQLSHLLDVFLMPCEIYPLGRTPLLLSLNHQFYFIHPAHTALGVALLRQLKAKLPDCFVALILDQPQVDELLQVIQAGADCCFRSADLLPPRVSTVLRAWKDQQRPPSWWNSLRRFWQRDPAFFYFDPDTADSTEEPATTTPSLHIQFFGPLSLQNQAGVSMSPGEGRLAALLACLLYHGHEGVHRDKLVYYFWANVPRESAYNSLHVAIHQLRQLLQHHFGALSIIERTAERYCLNPQLKLDTDIASFEQHAQRGQLLLQAGQQREAVRALEQAHQAYQDDFLAECKYQEWTIPIRDTLWERHLSVLETLLELFLQDKAYQKVIATGHQIHQLDSCLEKVHRQIMYAHYQLGQRAKALRQYEKCARILQQELQARPSQETQELRRIILQQSRIPVLFPLI